MVEAEDYGKKSQPSEAEIKKSLSLSTNNALQSSDCSWAVFSMSAVLNVYTVNRDDKTCNCSLICIYCNACTHRYSCTDASIQWNMCKHIHWVSGAQKLLSGERERSDLDVKENKTIKKV